MVPGGLEGGGDRGEGLREAYGGHAASGRAARDATWVPPGVDWSRTFAWPSLCTCGRARSVSSGVHAGYLGLWSMSLALATRPRHSSSYRLITLVVEIESMCIRGDVRGKGIGYPIGVG
jgi:hypothetical protein